MADSGHAAAPRWCRYGSSPAAETIAHRAPMLVTRVIGSVVVLGLAVLIGLQTLAS
jgi:hypothetical protein